MQDLGLQSRFRRNYPLCLACISVPLLGGLLVTVPLHPRSQSVERKTVVSQQSWLRNGRSSMPWHCSGGLDCKSQRIARQYLDGLDGFAGFRCFSGTAYDGHVRSLSDDKKFDPFTDVCSVSISQVPPDA